MMGIVSRKNTLFSLLFNYQQESLPLALVSGCVGDGKLCSNWDLFIHLEGICPLNGSPNEGSFSVQLDSLSHSLVPCAITTFLFLGACASVAASASSADAVWFNCTSETLQMC